ncbi:hypothetical protein E2C01_053564 [Portunus trituberculatus]|uniref:Uncharacterized protein n=1 Tax=Portunus trituberculatus TaxID=210409 RepID=A0A5B7GH38_PORTR|nr:hypothetical protein [Portunus trituberculatus]
MMRTDEGNRQYKVMRKRGERKGGGGPRVADRRSSGVSVASAALQCVRAGLVTYWCCRRAVCVLPPSQSYPLTSTGHASAAHSSDTLHIASILSLM